MKSAFWKSDWFFSLIVIIFVLSIHSCSNVIRGLERTAYDFGVSGSSRVPNDKIAIIAIDDESIENLGRWPWPRDIHAQMIDKLSSAGPKVIGYSPLFAEEQIDPGLRYINTLIQFYLESGLVDAPVAEIEQETTNEGEAVAENSPENPATDNSQENTAQTETPVALQEAAPNLITQLETLIGQTKGPLKTELQQALNNISNPVNELGSILLDAEDALNVDRQLAMSMAKANNVVTPMWFLFGEQLGNPDQDLPEYVLKNGISNINDSIGAAQLGYGYQPLETNLAVPPITSVGNSALAIGNINNYPDVDGGKRYEPLVIDYYGNIFPSYALMIAAKSLNLNQSDITVNLGQGLNLGRLEIGTDPQLKMLSFYYQTDGSTPAFSVDSFFEVYSGIIPIEKYKDKIVIIGSTASGIGNLQKTPINPVMSEVETLAHTVSSILNGDFFTSPEWANYVSLAGILLISIFLMFLLPRLNAKIAAIVTLTLFASILITHYVMITSQAMWLELILPATLLATGYILLTTKRFLVTETGKLRSDLESAESNRMLGLAFQGQGQLDMAFEKFRKCPPDDTLAETLYNLALDYERKRQFAKAGNVYQYIAEFNPKFRDVEQRINRSKKMEDTVMLGGGGGGSAAGTLILEGGDVEKPMLGRYEVEKELGKGAMGVVYLGKDPKISRVVAIKTMALSQEFEDDELEEVKERFFREAETAGRLNHPNIVTIYDAGEEHDLAYIAMEFLKGKDLAPYTKKENLLAAKTVVELVIKSAQALSYAHSQNVVHRDIKPANIMYDPESGESKITDFGIARITDSSKTKTGMVLGTPSYMSPEQLAGKKVDGRSDLFSLGVMLFQMLSGQLPFQADSMATLMYKITNETPPSILELQPDFPAYLDIVVTRSMEKEADDRYQTGDEMAADLMKCLEQL